DVGHDAEIAITFDGSGAGHGEPLVCFDFVDDGAARGASFRSRAKRAWARCPCRSGGPPRGPARYQRCCAKARLASARRWVSSRFLMAAARLSEASISSPASLRAIELSPRLRAESITQRMARARRREVRTSTGTW